MLQQQSIIVPQISTYPDPEGRARKVLRWLSQQRIVEPQLSTCVAGGNGMGYALAYPFAFSHLGIDGLPCIDPLPMWSALLADLSRATPVPVIAARFHKGLAIVIADLLKTLSRQTHRDQAIDTVALSGGVFQNRILLEQVVTRLERCGFTVLKHRRVPANDGGLALGQAVIAAARALAQQSNR